MYGKGMTLGGIGGAGLALDGVGIAWTALAALTVVALFAALWQLTPRGRLRRALSR
jgi:hypothetical protein